MFKTIVTLIRGSVAAAEQEVADRTALLVLDQQIRDAAGALDRSRRALAVAIAHDGAEGTRLESTLARLADLDERACAALAAGREDLATEAAETIAVMEADRDAIRQARAVFAAEAAELKAAVAQAGHRLADLERGRRIAQAAEAVRRLKATTCMAGSTPDAALADAEATLKRLRERQSEDAAAEAALQSLDPATAPDAMASRLEQAGFGRRTRTTAADVLDRLRRRVDAAAPAA